MRAAVTGEVQVVAGDGHGTVVGMCIPPDSRRLPHRLQALSPATGRKVLIEP
ncbi:MAG: hypothetical protein J2O39_01570 [Acidimicrobiales bacterium]|nr:hypothetical protein [Acidimicrobiales bacterium]MBO0893039.1 hypothetical protein [Acidimicrobiales bacterium]